MLNPEVKQRILKADENIRMSVEVSKKLPTKEKAIEIMIDKMNLEYETE